MPVRSPIWPAKLDHIRLDSPDPAALARFYGETLDMVARPLPDGTVAVEGRERTIVIGGGEAGTQPFSAFRLESARQLADLRDWLGARGVPMLPSPTALFRNDGVAVRDPDGRLAVFGLCRDGESAAAGGATPSLPGRLQHVVVASTRLSEMMRFYEEALGFVPSDYVRDGEERTVAFYRTDCEHHSFAVFRAPQSRPDHHSYETSCWNDIRDWADRMAARRIKLWWGPGRHGPGNNLFFMIQDPHKYLIELSAEIEVVPDEITGRFWPHEERTLNLWGPGFMRS